MMDIRESETAKNLQKAFEITAKRRMEYDIYALIAQKYGYKDIALLLSRFAEHEKEHSKLWYKWLNSSNGNLPSLLDSKKNEDSKEKNEIEGT